MIFLLRYPHILYLVEVEFRGFSVLLCSSSVLHYCDDYHMGLFQDDLYVGKR